MGKASNVNDAPVRFCGIPAKLMALCALTFQTVGMIYVLRLSRTQAVEGPRYLTSTAILLAEPLKFVVSLSCHAWTSSATFSDDLTTHIFASPLGMLKTSVPGLLYSLQNNLLFIGLSGLTASTYQLTCQLKILCTASMSVLILGTRLTPTQWFSLLVLTLGVATANMSGKVEGQGAQHHNTTIGLIATVAGCFLSAIASVSIEKLMKETTASIWIRNIQFAFWGTIFSGIIVLKTDGDKIAEQGFFQGYNAVVWVVVLSHALGGICVAMVLKYADNILKGFAGALAIVLSCALSVLVFHEAVVDRFLIMGVIFVILAANIYGFGLPDIAAARKSWSTKGWDLRSYQRPDNGETQPVLAQQSARREEP